MSETRYIISDAAKMINVEPHVLRYWEEELGMDIPRNDTGIIQTGKYGYLPRSGI